MCYLFRKENKLELLIEIYYMLRNNAFKENLKNNKLYLKIQFIIICFLMIITLKMCRINYV